MCDVLEEILLKYPAFWWAKDGARLAYLSINNSATPFMEIPHFLGGIYPSNVVYPYPKVQAQHFYCCYILLKDKLSCHHREDKSSELRSWLKLENFLKKFQTFNSNCLTSVVSLHHKVRHFEELCWSFLSFFVHSGCGTPQQSHQLRPM